jgi:hypothetical protein
MFVCVCVRLGVIFVQSCCLRRRKRKEPPATAKAFFVKQKVKELRKRMSLPVAEMETMAVEEVRAALPS